jgi:segregation and condensation protein B
MATEMARAMEAIIMVADGPVDPQLLAQLLERDVTEVEDVLRELMASYEVEDRGFILTKVAGGYRYQSHPDLAGYVERFVLEGQSSRLSAAALETLAIVAYKQPISRGQVAAIRGVNVDGVVRTLEQRGYIMEVGRDPGPGNPSLFGTTTVFLEKMGINSLDDLPPIADFVPGPEIVEQLEHGLRAEIDAEVAAEIGIAAAGESTPGGSPSQTSDDEPVEVIVPTTDPDEPVELTDPAADPEEPPEAGGAIDAAGAAPAAEVDAVPRGDESPEPSALATWSAPEDQTVESVVSVETVEPVETDETSAAPTVARDSWSAAAWGAGAPVGDEPSADVLAVEVSGAERSMADETVAQDAPKRDHGDHADEPPAEGPMAQPHVAGVAAAGEHVRVDPPDDPFAGEVPDPVVEPAGSPSEEVAPRRDPFRGYIESPARAAPGAGRDPAGRVAPAVAGTAGGAATAGSAPAAEPGGAPVPPPEPGAGQDEPTATAADTPTGNDRGRPDDRRTDSAAPGEAAPGGGWTVLATDGAPRSPSPYGAPPSGSPLAPGHGGRPGAGAEGVGTHGPGDVARWIRRDEPEAAHGEPGRAGEPGGRDAAVEAPGLVEPPPGTGRDAVNGSDGTL